MRRLHWTCWLPAAGLIGLTACPTVVPPEEMVDAGGGHFQPVDAGGDVAVLDARDRDAARHDAVRRDAATDRATPDHASDAATQHDHLVAADRATDAARSDAGADAARRDAGADAAPDAAVEDSGTEDGGLPLLRVEVDQAGWSEELYVDWTNPAGAICEDWCNPKTCNWGIYGTASIADDECGNVDTNWVEISNSHATTGRYRAKVYGIWCDSYGCGADEVRVFVGGVLRKRFIGEVEVSWDEQYLCLPVSNGSWDVANFDWPRSSCN